MLDAHRAAVRDPDAPQLAAEAVIALRRAWRRATEIGGFDAANVGTELRWIWSPEPERTELTYLTGRSAGRAGRDAEAESHLEAAAAPHAAAGRVPELALTTSG